MFRNDNASAATVEGSQTTVIVTMTYYAYPAEYRSMANTSLVIEDVVGMSTGLTARIFVGTGVCRRGGRAADTYE